jgi:hypothetical protein
MNIVSNGTRREALILSLPDSLYRVFLSFCSESENSRLNLETSLTRHLSTLREQKSDVDAVFQRLIPVKETMGEIKVRLLA